MEGIKGQRKQQFTNRNNTLGRCAVLLTVIMQLKRPSESLNTAEKQKLCPESSQQQIFANHFFQTFWAIPLVQGTMVILQTDCAAQCCLESCTTCDKRRCNVCHFALESHGKCPSLSPGPASQPSIFFHPNAISVLSFNFHQIPQVQDSFLLWLHT